MDIEIKLNENTKNCLIELAKQHKTSPSDIVAGLVFGFALSGFTDPENNPTKQKSKIKNVDFELTYKKRFAKRYSGSFDYLSLYGQKKYTNNETD
jgi:hypothetical protein